MKKQLPVARKGGGIFLAVKRTQTIRRQKKQRCTLTRTLHISATENINRDSKIHIDTANRIQFTKRIWRCNMNFFGKALRLRLSSPPVFCARTLSFKTPLPHQSPVGLAACFLRPLRLVLCDLRRQTHKQHKHPTRKTCQFKDAFFAV